MGRALLLGRAGNAPSTTLCRFLVGPKECKINGIDTTADGRWLFVNSKYPALNGTPANITCNLSQSRASGTGTGLPRSAMLVISNDDGGIVGL